MTALPTDKPMPFSAPMVRSLRANLKTKTRRGLTRLRGKFGKITEFGPSDTEGYDWTFRDKQMRWHDLRHDELLKVLKYQVGDVCYTTEAWRTEARYDRFPPSGLHGTVLLSFEADYIHEPNDGCRGKLRPSMFMCRWMSRDRIRITDVRIERLQDISEADAKAEGIYWSELYEGWTSGAGADESCDYHGSKAPVSFAKLWDRINGEGSWDQNPYVVAYSFERVQ